MHALASPIANKDRGTLLTVQQAWDYTAAIGKKRETRTHWQKVHKLILQGNAAPVGSPWMWTYANPRLRRNPRGGHGGVRKELAAGTIQSARPKSQSMSHGPVGSAPVAQ